MKSFTLKSLALFFGLVFSAPLVAQNPPRLLNVVNDCNPNQNERTFRVINAGTTNVNYTWNATNGQSGSGVAAPGNNFNAFITTPNIAHVNIYWDIADNALNPNVNQTIVSRTGQTSNHWMCDVSITSGCTDGIKNNWVVSNPNDAALTLDLVINSNVVGTVSVPAADQNGPATANFQTLVADGASISLKWNRRWQGFPVDFKTVSATFSGTACPQPCYASQMISYTPGTQANGNPLPNNRKDPNQALGAPQGNDTYNFVSLGRNSGTLILGFGGKINDGIGNDIKITETSFGNQTCNSYKERADVYATQNGVTWVLLGQVCLDGEVDLAAGGLSWATQIKIVDATIQNGSDGYDVDGVEVLSSCEALDNMATVLADLGQFAPNCGFDASDLPYDFDATKQAWVEALPTACRNPSDVTKAYKKGTQGILVGYRTDGKPGAWEIEVEGTCEIRVVRKMPNLPYGTALAHTSLLPDLKGLRWSHGWVYVIDGVNGTAISGRAVNVNGHTQSMCSGNFSASVAPGTEVPITWDLGSSCFYGRIGYGGTTSVECTPTIVTFCSNYYITGCTTSRGDETMTYEPTPATDYSIYPNPSSGLVNLEVINNGEEATVVTILDLSGRVIYNESFNGDVDTKLDLSNYTSGVYLVRIQQGGQTFVEKLMLN